MAMLKLKSASEQENRKIEMVIILIHMFAIKVKSFHNKAKSQLLLGGSFFVG